ncbi:MAG: restriction endonuclease [Chloroflexota bacterium]|nr:restriction endonuclease [Chloroflexota bacterium]
MTALSDLEPAIRALYPANVRTSYEIHEWRNASAVFSMVHPAEWSELMGVLQAFQLKHSYIIKGGGNKSRVAAFFDSYLYRIGWTEVLFDTSITVNQISYNVPTHKVDCFKNKIALEVEWNNKDPFFDRDLNNFRLLFELRTVDVGVIITRTDGLQAIVKSIGRGGSFGAATTHMGKLLPKIDGGGAGGCPVLVFGIEPSLYVIDRVQLTPEEQAEVELLEEAAALQDEDE